MLSVIVVAVVTGAASTFGSIWAKRKMERKTDQQTAELVAKVDTLDRKLNG